MRKKTTECSRVSNPVGLKKVQVIVNWYVGTGNLSMVPLGARGSLLAVETDFTSCGQSSAPATVG